MGATVRERQIGEIEFQQDRSFSWGITSKGQLLVDVDPKRRMSLEDVRGFDGALGLAEYLSTPNGNREVKFKDEAEMLGVAMAARGLSQLSEAITGLAQKSRKTTSSDSPIKAVFRGVEKEFTSLQARFKQTAQILEEVVVARNQASKPGREVIGRKGRLAAAGAMTLTNAVPIAAAVAYAPSMSEVFEQAGLKMPEETSKNNNFVSLQTDLVEKAIAFAVRMQQDDETTGGGDELVESVDDISVKVAQAIEAPNPQEVLPIYQELNENQKNNLINLSGQIDPEVIGIIPTSPESLTPDIARLVTYQGVEFADENGALFDVVEYNGTLLAMSSDGTQLKTLTKGDLEKLTVKSAPRSIEYWQSRTQAELATIDNDTYKIVDGNGNKLGLHRVEVKNSVSGFGYILTIFPIILDPPTKERLMITDPFEDEQKELEVYSVPILLKTSGGEYFVEKLVLGPTNGLAGYVNYESGAYTIIGQHVFRSDSIENLAKKIKPGKQYILELGSTQSNLKSRVINYINENTVGMPGERIQMIRDSFSVGLVVGDTTASFAPWGSNSINKKAGGPIGILGIIGFVGLS
ncbi:hypothetical protein HYT59_02435 [Candidatus Woesebacteria bacterium]|nr:hypothetical protein [Candidatus Woesebacteria bacterium]